MWAARLSYGESLAERRAASPHARDVAEQHLPHADEHQGVHIPGSR